MGSQPEAADPEVAGAHAEHAQPGAADLVQLDRLGDDAAELVKGHAEVDGESLVRERVDADGLVVDAPHALVQGPDVHGYGR